jgi:hypothetical protein
MRPADTFVLILAFAVLGILYTELWGDGIAGDQVRILVGDKQLALVSLKQDQQMEVAGALGSSTLEISDGRIRFVDSACSEKLCVRNSWVSKGGQVVACLPNKVSVAILGGDYRFDAINF